MATGRIGVTPVLRTRWSKLPTTGTTVLSGLDDNSVALVYDAGYEAVYRNGVLLSRGNDYTATNGTTVTLIDATLAGDVVEIFANDLVPLTDAISKGQYNAKGALLSATAASTPAVLAVGTNDQVLTADSTTSTGLKWAAPAAGGMTVIASGTLSGTSTSLTSIPSTYINLVLFVNNPTVSSGTGSLGIRINSSSTAQYGRWFFQSNGSNGGSGSSQTQWLLSDGSVTNIPTSNDYVSASITFPNYADTTSQKSISYQIQDRPTSFSSLAGTGGTFVSNTSAISSIQILSNGAAFAGGTYTLYGVK
jgi:hypothetical protein